MKNLLLLLLLSLGTLGTSYAQDVSIGSSVAAELIVCGNSEAFTINVTNDFSTTLIGISLNVVFPQGISYEAGSISETTTYATYGVTESNIINLSSISLAIGDLPQDSTVSFTFNAAAGFDAIAYQNAGNSFRNNITVSYNGGNTTGQSDAYNILFAALSITQVTPMTKDVFVGETYTRQVKVVNGGSGSVNTFILNDIYDNVKVKTTGTDKGTLSVDGSQITLTSSDFTSIGNGDGWLDLNESIIIKETIYAVGCVDAQSQLYATWGCGGQSTISNDKFPFTDISLYAPNIKASAIPSFNTYLNVNTADQQQILLINTGTGPANALEVEAYQTNGNGYDLNIFSRIDENSVQYKIGINGTFTAIVPTSTVVTTSTGVFSCLGSNPIGKVVLDLPILQPGDSMYIVWDSYTCDNITECGSIDLIGWDYKVSYTDMCAQDNYVQDDEEGQKPQKKGFSVFSEYPTDLADGQAGEFAFRLTDVSFEMPLTGHNPYLAVKFTIPNGLLWSGNNSDLKYIGGNTEWTPSYVTYTNGVLEAQYAFPKPFDLLNSEFQLDLTGDCATGSNGALAVDMQLFFVMDGSDATGEVTSYVLTDSLGEILEIASTPTFTGLTTTDYGSYVVNYETVTGITGLIVGQNILNVSSSGCLNISDPYSFRICPLGLPTTSTICNYIGVTDVTLSETGGSNAAGETTSYVLTDLSGQILTIESTPTFTGLTTTDYGSYAVSYETVSGITGLTIGQNILDVSSSGCFNISAPYSFKICTSGLPTTPTICNYAGVTDVTLSETGGSNAAGETTSYVLTDLSGQILTIENTPTFTGLTTTDYGSYAVSYDTTGVVTGLTIGQSILNVSSSGCFNISAPYSFRICSLDLPVTSTTCNYIGVTNVTLSKSGGSNAAGETTSYVLTDLSGQILAIENTPTFTSLTTTDYGSYAVSYDITGTVTGLVIGQNILNVSSSGCFNISAPYSFRICQSGLPTPPTTCSYTGVTNVSLSQMGGVSCIPASEMPMTCLTSISTQLHCPSGSCVGMDFNGFEVERTSFGLPDNDRDGVPDATGSLDMNAIELDRMMVNDTFKTTFTGIVHTDATHLNWQYGYAYTKMPRGNEIDIIGASITVIDQSTGQTLTCNNVPFTSVMSGTDRDINFDYSVATLTGLGCSDFNSFVYEDGDQVILSGTYKVIGNIGSTTLQVLITNNTFYLSDIQNPTSSIDEYSCDDWNGTFTLVGYDLNNYDENSITLDRYEKVITQFYKLQIGSGDVFNDLFPSEYRNWGYLKQVNLELPAGYSATKGRFYQYSTKYSNVSRNDSTSNNLQPISVTPNGSGGSIYAYDLEQHYELNGGNISVSDDGFYGEFHANIRATCAIPQETYEDVNWTFEYNNSAFIGGGTSGAIASSTPDYIRYRRGEMELSSTQQTVDGIGSSITWTVKVKPTGTVMENAFLAFGSNAINVFEVRDAISNVLIVENNGLYELGDINENQTKSYTITATYSNCSSHQLNVFAGYDYDAYPLSLGASCSYETYPLFVNLQPSALKVAIVGTTPANPCEPRVTVEVDMLSSKLASVQNLFINIKVPSNNSLELEADSTAVQYPVGSSYTSLTNPVLVGDTMYQITATNMDAVLGTDGLEGITNTSVNNVKVKFNLYMNSNFESGSFAEITVGGYSVCGLELPSVSLAYDPNSVFAKVDNALVGLDSQEDNWSTAFGDYDNDGSVDLFVVNYSTNGLNQLYHNNGDGTFTKVTSGNPIVTDIASSTSAVWGDYDNDGDLDLYVSNNIGSKNFLYRNEGNGNFVSILNDPIVNYTGYSHGAAWADYDGDGYMDMFVSDYFSTRFNKLYHNNGDGTFTEVTSSPVVTDASFSVSAAWGDYDNDGDQDLFVPNTNDENNFLYRNEGNGQFSKITTGDIVNDGGKSVGASWGDYDNDLDLDLFVSNAGEQNNFLYQNNGNGTFTKITSSIVTMDGGNSHGSAWGDYDNDGDIDLLVSNDANGDNFLYANNGDGTFVAIGNVITQDAGKSFGAAWADVDNDLDLDLHISNHDDEDNFLYLNERGKCAAKACFTFTGTNTNASAFGSRVKVLATIDGVQRWQMRELTSLTGGGIGGQNELKTLIGLADATQIDSMIIEWGSGVVQTFGSMAIDTCWAITEEDGSKVCGIIYEDVNGNCQQDVNEDGIPNIPVTVQPGNRQVYTDENGAYAFNLAPGTYTVTQIENAAWKQSCGGASKIVNVLGIGNEYCGNDFADTAACQSPDLYIELATTALRVGFENLYAITFGNNGTEAAINTVLKVDFSQYVIPLSSSLPWDSKVGTEFTWNIGALEIGQQFTIYVEDSVSTAATIGNNITVIATIVDDGSTNVDCNTTDNIVTDLNEAVGAIDPNDIQVSPEGFISVDQELIYKIRFQNVGNNLVNRVVLRDELPEGLDLTTLIRGAASHPYQFRIEGERTLVWEFDNINLPDSTSNEPESHGFATFKIIPQLDLSDGVELPNSAEIYFDNSAVVITNTVINTIGEPADVKPGDMIIFPNPMRNYTTIRIIPRQVDLNEEEIESIEVFTSLGVKVISLNSLTGTRVTIAVGELSVGYYIVQVRSNKGILYVGKLLVGNL